MRFAVLGSGSKGNCTIVESGNTRVLIDCGFNVKETTARLLRLGIDAGDIDAILVTHEHSDHLGGVARVARKYETPVWITNGTRRAWKNYDKVTVNVFDPHTEFAVGDLHIQPFPVPHDANEPSQFVLSDGNRKLGIVSDVGCITRHMVEVLQKLDALLLEFNHDEAMLQAGPYPHSLKLRVGGNLGHLSNRQSSGLLEQIDVSALQHLILTHLSEQNNTPELALNSASSVLNTTPDWLFAADQTEGLDWRMLA